MQLEGDAQLAYRVDSIVRYAGPLEVGEPVGLVLERGWTGTIQLRVERVTPNLALVHWWCRHQQGNYMGQIRLARILPAAPAA